MTSGPYCFVINAYKLYYEHMKIISIKTPRIEAHSTSLESVIEAVVNDIQTKSVLAISSKIVSLCEGSVVAAGTVDKMALIETESDYYMPDAQSAWGINFTITDGILIPNAGIDESNAGDVEVLWPKDAQRTANAIRKYLSEKYNVSDIGVIITDSTVRPLRRGVSGIAIAYSGFKPLRDYVQTPDLFGRPFAVSQSDIVGGLASAAVLAMGEGAESTPLALMSELDTINFVRDDPSPEELEMLRIPLEEDLFAPFLTKARWKKGGRNV